CGEIRLITRQISTRVRFAGCLISFRLLPNMNKESDRRLSQPRDGEPQRLPVRTTKSDAGREHVRRVQRDLFCKPGCRCRARNCYLCGGRVETRNLKLNQKGFHHRFRIVVSGGAVLRQLRRQERKVSEAFFYISNTDFLYWLLSARLDL